jgi:hypothetical protein
MATRRNGDSSEMVPLPFENVERIRAALLEVLDLHGLDLEDVDQPGLGRAYRESRAGDEAGVRVVGRGEGGAERLYGLTG